MRLSIKLICFFLFISLLLSCQKYSSDDSIPVEIPSDSATRTSNDYVSFDQCPQFEISEAIARQFIEESESSVVIRNIEPYEADGDVPFYVVNLDKGWRIISSDARAKAVLAKGESGSFDLSTMDNLNVQFWLQDTQRQTENKNWIDEWIDGWMGG